MEFDPQDQDIIRLLTKLKDVPVEYPVGKFAAQRQIYLQRMMEIGLGISGAAVSEKATGPIKPPSVPPATSTLLETALIVAIVTEASLMAYFYRDQLADFFQTITSGTRVEEVAPLPVIPTSPEVQGIRPSPATVSTLPTTSLATSPAGLTVTPTRTPIPAMVGDNSSTPGVSVTPVPNGNNGHHYGQTPKPERTKENNGNKDKPPKDDDNKPPKEKPTKAK